MKKIKTDKQNHLLESIRGKGLLRLAFDNTMSKNAPLGQRFLHQYLPSKKDNTSKNTIMATTKYPKSE
jgi:hypothetical protein